MLDNKVIFSTGGIILAAPAKPFIALMAVGIVTIGVGIYCLANIVGDE